MRLSHGLSGCSLVFALVAGFGVTGCADPTEGKPKAVVQESTRRDTARPELPSKPGVGYSITTAHSHVSFVGSKVTGSHDGGFKSFGGQIDLVDADPTQSAIQLMIDTKSLWTDTERLTEHLKSPDFFDVATYPRAVFASTRIERDGDKYVISGDLDLHGVKKNISFPAEITVGDATIEAKSEFSLKRFDFGIVYPGKTDDLIRDDVLIKLDLVANRARPADGTMAR